MDRGPRPMRGRSAREERRLTRREVLASASWSAAALTAAATWPLGCFSVYLDDGAYGDYIDSYDDYPDYPDFYCDCGSDYSSTNPYCDYGDYTDACYADIYCDCGANYYTTDVYCDYLDYSDGC